MCSLGHRIDTELIDLKVEDLVVRVMKHNRLDFPLPA